jgi:hypothetical protein
MRDPLMRAVVLPALILLAALTACGGKKDEGPERKTAAGEVLGGTISDAMLPLATVTSQSPPLRENASDAGSSDETGPTPDSDEGDSEAPAPSSSASATPAAQASATPAPAAEE